MKKLLKNRLLCHNNDKLSKKYYAYIFINFFFKILSKV